MNIDEQWIRTADDLLFRARRGGYSSRHQAEIVLEAVVPLVVAAARQEWEAELERVGYRDRDSTDHRVYKANASWRTPVFVRRTSGEEPR